MPDHSTLLNLERTSKFLISPSYAAYPIHLICPTLSCPFGSTCPSCPSLLFGRSICWLNFGFTNESSLTPDLVQVNSELGNRQRLSSRLEILFLLSLESFSSFSFETCLLSCCSRNWNRISLFFFLLHNLSLLTMIRSTYFSKSN